jgi:hypothetical protein
VLFERTCLVAGFCAVLLPVPASAHHSFEAEFDAKKPITLIGVVKRIEWTHPHAWIHVDVKGPDGRNVSWAIQAASPEALTRRGWRTNSLVPGALITIDAFQARNRPATANGRDITLSDGRQLCANIPCRCCRQ